ncbi:SPOR domain-containing protein [Luteimonas sp. SJ-92]|uniref:SPOR domain-containing protein n=1 Tax=Luteimonas salinisoli TaxID=2752307 RepID=A0A853JE33_9GAMM|nr:SPOR domain-containing protein [Luteimonas salinisoli]
MAVKRGKSQARRNSGGNGGLPGWAWMVLGVVLAVVVILAAPRLLKSEGEDGFYRPRPNPDAQPPAASGDEQDSAPARADAPPGRPAAQALPEPGADYDFYTLLPGQEVPMTDAELAASARAEESRQAQARRSEDAAELADPAAAGTAATATPTTTPEPAAAAASADASARYLLQAGAFSASGDAEALKARIALLGLSARVESAQVEGRTIYRVRMGPYGSATELADAKGKLGDGGLPAMAIKVQ